MSESKPPTGNGPASKFVKITPAPEVVSDSSDKPQRPSPLERIHSEVANERARGLLSLSTAPDKSREVIARLEELLHDHSAALIGVPHLYGEVRFLAAQALAVVRARMGNTEVVTITDCPRTVTARRIGSYARPFDLGPMSGEKLYAKVRDLGGLPTRDYVFDPAEYPSKSRRETADEATESAAESPETSTDSSGSLAKSSASKSSDSSS